jgi:hypothetical protein
MDRIDVARERDVHRERGRQVRAQVQPQLRQISFRAACRLVEREAESDHRAAVVTYA